MVAGVYPPMAGSTQSLTFGAGRDGAVVTVGGPPPPHQPQVEGPCVGFDPQLAPCDGSDGLACSQQKLSR